MKSLGKAASGYFSSRVYTVSLMLLAFVFVGFFSNVSAKDLSSQNYLAAAKKGKPVNEKIDENHYVFYTTVKDRTIKWEVIMNDGKIKELYRDDTLLESRTYPVYETMVNREIENIEKAEEESDDEAYRKSDDIISFNFDSRQFEENMEALCEQLKDLKVEYNFNADDLEELTRDLSEIEINIPDIDLSALEELNDLEINIDSLKINLDGLKEQMRTFKDFMREFKSEIVADGLVKKYDDINNLDFEDGNVYLNYEKVPDNLAKKYVEIYKKHFGEYPEGNFFSFNR